MKISKDNGWRRKRKKQTNEVWRKEYEEERS
jgi:hypothetical protein